MLAGISTGRVNCSFDVLQELPLSVYPRRGLPNVRARLGLRPQDSPNIRPYAVIEAHHTLLSEAVRAVEDEGCPGSREVTVMADVV